MANERWYERLNPTDSMFLHLEDGRSHMHVGGVFVYQGRPPSYRDFVRFVSSRLDRVPRYRQRLAPVPLGIGRPVWVDDDRFDPEFHLHASALPAPGDDAALRRAVARIFGRPLDRTRPLWDLELVEGLAGDRFAVVSRTHHSVLDGIAGNDVITAITDDAPIFGTTGVSEPWIPRPAPGRAALVVDAVRDQALVVADTARKLLQPGSSARRALGEAAAGVLPLLGLAVQGRAPTSSLNAPVGPHRAWEMASVSLGTVKAIRAVTGTTVNDVVLAVVAGALREVLLGRGEPLDDRLRAFVPVNVRPAEAAGVLDNHVAAVFCPLPLAEPDPLRRLARISEAMRHVKRSRQAAASLLLARLGEATPTPVAAGFARLEIAWRRFNLVVSNIPGPQAPRYMLGRRLLAFHPLIPLSGRQLLSVGAYSYAGAIHFGLAADLDRAADVAQLARAVPAALDGLSAALPAPPAGRTERASSPAAARTVPAGPVPHVPSPPLMEPDQPRRPPPAA